MTGWDANSVQIFVSFVFCNWPKGEWNIAPHSYHSSHRLSVMEFKFISSEKERKQTWFCSFHQFFFSFQSFPLGFNRDRLFALSHVSLQICGRLQAEWLISSEALAEDTTDHYTITSSLGLSVRGKWSYGQNALGSSRIDKDEFKLWYDEINEARL